MSENPTSQALMAHLSKTEPDYQIHVSVVMMLVQMERLLRGLRASANCYVSADRLKEVDDFLSGK